MKPGKHSLLEYATAGFALVAAIGGIWAAIASTHQAAIASDTEKRQLRAYVSMSQIVIEAVSRVPNGEIDWMAEAVWRNSGATPTRGLMISSDVGAKYDKGPTISERETAPLALGPNDEAFVFGGSVPTSKISSFRAKGIAVYQDAFGHERITMACRSADSDPEILKDAKVGDTVTLHSRPCGVESCADEDCKAFRDQIGDKVPAAAYEP